jgi:hypothetical protein
VRIAEGRDLKDKSFNLTQSDGTSYRVVIKFLNHPVLVWAGMKGTLKVELLSGSIAANGQGLPKLGYLKNRCSAKAQKTIEKQMFRICTSATILLSTLL